MNLWRFGRDTAEGLALELTDGSDHLLGHDCIERLPGEALGVFEAALATERGDV